MIISVASGKGGTGKTTVSTNMAFSLESGVQILDCDVEEPNAHLFLNPEIKKKETVYTPVPLLDGDKCNLCGKCVDICRFKSIVVVGKSLLTFPALCHSCGGCIEVCPENALTETGKEIGYIEKGSCGDIDFVHGTIRIGEPMAPPLIREVKTSIKNDYINIIDAPPGTACPVIAAMKDSDFILMVTEPTPFGLHDLKLGVEAVKVLGIPCGLVINRSDIGNNEVWEYAEKEKIPVLMEIPFNRKIAEAYSRGHLIVEEMPEFNENFIGLFNKIKDIVEQRN